MWAMASSWSSEEANDDDDHRHRGKNHTNNTTTLLQVAQCPPAGAPLTIETARSFICRQVRGWCSRCPPAVPLPLSSPPLQQQQQDDDNDKEENDAPQRLIFLAGSEARALLTCLETTTTTTITTTTAATTRDDDPNENDNDGDITIQVENNMSSQFEQTCWLHVNLSRTTIYKANDNDDDAAASVVSRQSNHQQHNGAVAGISDTATTTIDTPMTMMKIPTIVNEHLVFEGLMRKLAESSSAGRHNGHHPNEREDDNDDEEDNDDDEAIQHGLVLLGCGVVKMFDGTSFIGHVSTVARLTAPPPPPVGATSAPPTTTNDDNNNKATTPLPIVYGVVYEDGDAEDCFADELLTNLRRYILAATNAGSAGLQRKVAQTKVAITFLRGRLSAKQAQEQMDKIWEKSSNKSKTTTTTVASGKRRANNNASTKTAAKKSTTTSGTKKRKKVR